MKNKSIVTFCLLIIVAILLNLVAFFGLPGVFSDKFGGMFDAETGMRQGIDLAGGSVITFEAQAENPTQEQMEAVRAVYETRLNGAGYTESRISVNEGGKVTIEIPNGGAPAKEGEKSNGTTAADTDEAVELLSQVAKLTFRDADNNVVLNGEDVKSAKSIYGQPSENSAQQYYVQVNFSSDGTKKFAEATGKAAAETEGRNIIQICMDENVVSAPSVAQRIDSDSCVITGNFTAEAASTLANQINSGNLPFEMKKITQETVGAELGQDALPKSLLAAGIGILLIMLFMIIRYRLPGAVACISLLIYVGLICLAIGVFRVNLSLSGIAGIVLSIGMAVDADCIIFERVKEELAIGKSIRASVESGFSKALSAIVDSNITTIITCVVLYMSGIGTVTGFATTLGIGVILSMFTAIVITKILMRNLVNMGVTNKNLFYKSKKVTGGAENE
ncbi:MAG: protein translocase subunit SecD [Clostridia bacterium]|nr:protein translocase subunit SecD [Clostridia bacterium]